MSREFNNLTASVILGGKIPVKGLTEKNSMI